MTRAEAHAAILAKFPDAIVREGRAGQEAGDPYLVVKPERLHDVVKWMKEDPGMWFEVLQCLSGVDYGKDLGSVYHLDSWTNKVTVTLRVELPREKPEVASITDLYGAADWHEREAFDLLGIVYTGHPKLVRILCAEDWVGHPLRKDYVFPKEYHGIKNDL